MRAEGSAARVNFPPHVRRSTPVSKRLRPHETGSSVRAEIDLKTTIRTCTRLRFLRTRGDRPGEIPAQDPDMSVPPHARRSTLHQHGAARTLERSAHFSFLMRSMRSIMVGTRVQERICPRRKGKRARRHDQLGLAVEPPDAVAVRLRHSIRRRRRRVGEGVQTPNSWTSDAITARQLFQEIFVNWPT